MTNKDLSDQAWQLIEPLTIFRALSRHSFWAYKRDIYEGENREEAHFLPRLHHGTIEALDPSSWQVPPNQQYARENLFRKHATCEIAQLTSESF